MKSDSKLKLDSGTVLIYYAANTSFNTRPLMFTSVFTYEITFWSKPREHDGGPGPGGSGLA